LTIGLLFVDELLILQHRLSQVDVAFLLGYLKPLRTPEILLQGVGLKWDFAAEYDDSQRFLSLLRTTDADIRQIDADSGTASPTTRRTLCQTTSTRQLNLLGLKLSVSDAYTIIESHALTLARIELSISFNSTSDEAGRISLPQLTHLRVECLHPNGSTTLSERKECINAAWTLMLHLDMPHLLELDIAGVCLTGSHYASILSYLSPTPKLQVLRVRRSFPKPAKE
jgi:hypothetical protein